MNNVVKKKIPLSLLNIEILSGGNLVINTPLQDTLNRLKETGSLKKTAYELGVSYTYLWNSLKEVGENEGEPLFEGKRGGFSGGGTKLTPTGDKLIIKSNTLKREVIKKIRLIENEEFSSLDLTIIGSQCTGLKVLTDLIKQKNTNLRIKVLHAGSLIGVSSIQTGSADIAGVHILDEETETYNTSFLKAKKISEDTVLVKGYLREQGLFVKKGNPKGIQSIKDLLIGDIVFINRNKGSGTRILLDILLKKISDQRRISSETLLKKIKGYQNEVPSSIEVAEAVSKGIADTGFGIEAEAKNHNLDFIRLAMENYDFIVRKDRLKKRGVKIFLEILRSQEYRYMLKKKTVGIHPTVEIGRILT